MEVPETNIQRMIQELNQYILPSTPMESFDAYREEAYKEATRSIAPSTLAWFLDMFNQYHGHEGRKESLLDVFDPGMSTVNHPAGRRLLGRRSTCPRSVRTSLIERNEVRTLLKSQEARSGSSGSMPIPTTMRSLCYWG